MSNAQDSYDRFRATLAEISALVAPAKEQFANLSMGGWVDVSDRTLQRLGNECFRVIFLGEFKRGKSTVINALLGREVLPAFATPCTAIINILRWGEEPRAILHFRDPLPAKLPNGLAREALAHIELHRGQPVPALSIRTDDLERFVVIPDPSRDQAASIAESPYRLVEIFWPLPLLRNGVEIIDSPGLNEHGSRTRVTMDFLGKVDAVVFVLSVHALASESELTVIDQNVRAAGHEDIFFVCNRFDELRRPADRDRVVSYSYEHLAPRTAMAREGVFFVSALDALIGREEAKPDLVARSNFPALETSLARFLVNERGRIKLHQPARQLAQGLKTALFEVIPGQRKLLSENLTDLEERYASAKPRLAEADARRQAIMARLDRARVRLRDAVRTSAALHLRNVASQIPMWATQLSIESRINAMKFLNLEGQMHAVAEEVVQGVTPMIEAATAEWRERQLEPMVEDSLKEIGDAAGESIRDFLLNLEEIRADLSQLASNAKPKGTTISSIERVLSGAGGLIIGGAGSALEGATMGFQGMIRGLIPQLVIGIVGIVVLHLNPLTVIPAMIGLGVFRTMRQGNALTDRVKGEVGKHLADALIASLPEQAENMALAIHEQTEPMMTEINSGLENEIRSIKEQMAVVLATKQAGVDEVKLQLERVAVAERELQRVDTEVSAFILRLASTRF